jgi:gliding motility-associated-like protein
VNDLFGPSGFGIDSEDFIFQIFDRWGNLIYSTTDITKPWNGKASNGSTVAVEDVYIYALRIRDLKGNNHPIKGRVTIIK